MATSRDANDVEIQWSQRDIIVASFLETSSVWTQAVITLISRTEGKENSTNTVVLESNQEVLLQHWTRLTDSASSEQVSPGVHEMPRLFTTNLKWEKLPQAAIDSGAKIIYVYSRLKDVIFATYVRSVETATQNACNDDKGQTQQSFGDFVDEVLQGGDASFLEEYFENIKGYWKHRDDDNVQIIFSGDLSKDPAGGILQIASFMDKQLNVDQFQEIFNSCNGPHEYFDKCHAQVHVDQDAVVREKVNHWSKEKLTEHGLDPAFFCV